MSFYSNSEKSRIVMEWRNVIVGYHEMKIAKLETKIARHNLKITIAKSKAIQRVIKIHRAKEEQPLISKHNGEQNNE